MVKKVAGFLLSLETWLLCSPVRIALFLFSAPVDRQSTQTIVTPAVMALGSWFCND